MPPSGGTVFRRKTLCVAGLEIRPVLHQQSDDLFVAASTAAACSGVSPCLLRPRLRIRPSASRSRMTSLCPSEAACSATAWRTLQFFAFVHISPIGQAVAAPSLCHPAGRQGAAPYCPPGFSPRSRHHSSEEAHRTCHRRTGPPSAAACRLRRTWRSRLAPAAISMPAIPLCPPARAAQSGVTPK